MKPHALRATETHRPLTTRSWLLAGLAVVLALVSAVGIVVTQEGSGHRTVADSLDAGGFGPLLAVGGACLGVVVLLVAMVVTAVQAGDARTVNGGSLRGRVLMIMGGGLLVSFVVWVSAVTGWALLS